MNKLVIYGASKELLKEIRWFYPPAYYIIVDKTIFLECQIIMHDPYLGTYTCLLSDKHTKVSLTVSLKEAHSIYVRKGGI